MIFKKEAKIMLYIILHPSVRLNNTRERHVFER